MRLVLKVGTRVLCHDDGIGLDEKAIARLCQVIISLSAQHEVLLVTSGAVGAGLLATGKQERPTQTPQLQALAAIGQSLLMQAYAQALGKERFHAAQLLLSYADLDSPDSRQRVEQTLHSLWQIQQTIPIINENDSVGVDELRFGDNDLLSARVACLLRADLLILFTSVDGFYQQNAQGEQSLVSQVKDIESLKSHVQSHQDKLSTGGMASKLNAISHALDCGIPATILHGRQPERLSALLKGESVPCTQFFP